MAGHEGGRVGESMTGGIDPRQFRDALGSFATGVTIVTTRDNGGRDVGLTANSFNSVSLDPPMVLWSLAKTSSNLEAFAGAEHFAVHILAADQEALSNRFAGKGADKFAGLSYRRNAAGVPLLGGCAALFQCRTAFRHDGGDHIIFVGEVAAFDHLEKPPLVYHGGRYVMARHKEPAAGNGSPDEASLGDLIARAHLQLVAPLRRNAEHVGLSVAERYAMSVLMAGGALDLPAIDAIIGRTGVRASLDLVEGLVTRGLLIDEPGEDEAVRYRLSDEGRRKMIELYAAAKALEADVLAALTEDEQRLLHELLLRLVHGIMARSDDRAVRHMELMRVVVSQAEAG
ncbi:MAG: flavin reductase family protein [Novosphingobium sp.]